jgi:hypothetical protein
VRWELNLVKGFSEGAGDGWMVILGLGAGSALRGVAGVEDRAGDDSPPLSPEDDAPCGGPESFSMRRLRI